MKKTLSLVLAAVLAFGMTATAFAANHAADGTLATGAAPVFKDSTSVASLLETNSDGNISGTATTFSNADAAYIEINTDGDMKAADVKKFKIKGEWDVGKDLVEKVSIVYKKDVTTPASPVYGYFAEIKFKPGVKVSKDDLQGKVTIYKSSVKSPTQGTGADATFTGEISVGINKVGEASVKFVDTIGSGSTDTTNHTVWSSSSLAPGGSGQPVANAQNGYYAKVVSFDKSMEEATITFDGVGEFDVNVNAQDKLYLGFDRKVKNDVIAKYSYANVEFINFPGEPMFNRTGVFHMYADDENTFVYSMNADGVITPVKTTWDTEYDAHKFSVRKFAPTYIISDVELELDATEEVVPVEPTTPVVPGKENPNTGR